MYNYKCLFDTFFYSVLYIDVKLNYSPVAFPEDCDYKHAQPHQLNIHFQLSRLSTEMVLFAFHDKGNLRCLQKLLTFL